jgi:hypothetical protein
MFIACLLGTFKSHIGIKYRVEYFVIESPAESDRSEVQHEATPS